MSTPSRLQEKTRATPAFAVQAKSSLKLVETRQAQDELQSSGGAPAQTHDWAMRLSIGLSLLATVFGAIVIAGWQAGRMSWVQWAPGITPVAYNAGICFVLAGAAVLAIRFATPLWTRALASSALAIGALTLAGYLGAQDHVPSLFSAMRLGPWQQMAPNTAACFVLVSCALVLATFQSNKAAAATALLTGVSASMAIAGICGYAANLPAAYMWGQVKPMAPQAAVTLIVLSAAIIAWAWGHERRTSKLLPAWLPGLVLLASAGFSLALWAAVRVSHRNELLPALVLGFGVASAALSFMALRLTRRSKLQQERIQDLNRKLRQEIERAQRAERESRAASLYARSLIEASLDPLATISKDGKIMDVNRATEQITGLGREHLIGTDFSSHFTDPPQARAGYEQVFAAGSVKDYGLAIRQPDGSVREVLYNATVFRNECGEVDGVFAAARDITERKRMEEELRVNQQRLALALKAAVAGNFDWNMRTNVNVWSRETEELYGLPPGQFLGTYEAWEALVLPEDLPGAHAAIEAALKSGDFSCEWRIRRPVDGEVRWIAARAKVLRDEHGEPLRMIGINIDVTARKQAEAALLASEQRYRALTEATSQIVWTTAPNGEVTRDMPLWRRFTGATESEIRGWGWLNSLHEDDRAPTTAAWKAALAARNTYETEYRIRRCDGEYRYMWVRGVPVLNAKGELAEWVGTCTDITERKQSELQLRQLTAALQDRTRALETSNKELEAFAYSVSHDLRAPLRSIDGFSQILLEDYAGQFDDNGKDCLRRVRAGCQSMGQLIDAVLQLSRISRSQMQPEDVDLSLMALNEAAMLQHINPHRRVEFHVAAGLRAHGDRKLLQVALQNLVENAWKFTSKQPRARIEVGRTDRDGQRVFFVRDNGAGFDMAYAGKLFQPFQRLHSNEDYSGSGIGLATVQRVLQRVGGRIWAEGTPGQGATFYFCVNQGGRDE